MIETGWVFCAALLTAAVIQWAVARAFESSFLKSCRESGHRATSELPAAAILMSVRGADPSLPTGIDSLLRQDHPDYELYVVVDHELDPAWPILQQVQAEHPQGARLKLCLMRTPAESCSLKCHSLVQAF